jgi:hypothetical protein
MTFGVEKQVLWLDVAMGDALTVEIGHPVQHLFKTTFNFTGTHPSVDIQVGEGRDAGGDLTHPFLIAA